MTISGFIIGPSKYFLIPARGAKSLCVEFPSVISIARPKGKFRSLHGGSRHQSLVIRSAMDASYSDPTGHKPSLDAIESAHNKIIMQKFYERKNPKIDVKKKVREVTQSRSVRAVMGRFQTPSSKFIIKTAATFLVLGLLTVLFPTEEGPTLQVAISLIATIYFIHDRLQSKLRAFLYGAGAFILFRSNNFTYNLHSAQGFFYLSEVGNLVTFKKIPILVESGLI